MIKQLVKISIKQFSYRQITNAAFSHVMNLIMEFHAERDSAEKMKAIKQDKSLTNLLKASVMDITPTFMSLIITCIFLY